jgi:UDP:flavonoid glycosyltransferase YjiC (YdhE family)
MNQETSKPAVLFFPFDLLSHYSRCIQLAESIQNNFEIYFSSSKKYNDLIFNAGFKVFDCESFDPQIVLEDSRKFNFSWLNYENIKRVFQSQVKIIQKFKPFAVFSDTAPTLKMAAEFTNTKHVSLMNGYMSKYYALTRKISKDHMAAKFENDLPKNLFEKMINTGEQVTFHLIERSFNKLRRENNLPKCKMYLDELEGDFSLICDDAEMFPQKNLPQNYKIIGPLYYEGEDKEPEIEKFMQNDKSSILVNIGSSGDLKKFSFLNNDYFKDFNIVVTGEKNTGLTGKNVITRSFINNLAILDKIDLVLCHGGNGTIYQALAYGVPLICATSIFEQEWNAQRVEDLKFGVCIDNIESDNEKIEIVKQWIDKKSIDHFQNIKKKMNISTSINNFKKFMDVFIKNVSDT